MVTVYGIRVTDLPTVSDAKKRFACVQPWCCRHPNHPENDASRAGMGGLLVLRAAKITEPIAYTDAGRPFVSDPTVDFNVTHTNRHVFVAIDRQEDAGYAPRVGIDAEELTRALPRLDALAERWFSKAEQRTWELTRRPEDFLRIWTQKEAFVKWTGEGFAAATNRDTSVLPDAYGVAFHSYLADGACVSLCTKVGVEVAREIRMLSADELIRMLKQN